MLQEIREQPEALERLLDQELGRVSETAQAARAREVGLLFLAARGTSDHAAVYARYLSEIVAGIPASLAAPSVFTLYRSEVRLEHALVLGISQSGRAADALEVMHAARSRGQLTACITNDHESPMAASAEFPLYCHAGLERSLPATKTYTTSLALVYALVAGLAGRPGLLTELYALPGWIRTVLALETEIAAKAERYRFMDECVVLARGINQCTGFEAALKLSETSYLRAHPYSAADFLHGPIAVVGEGYPCLVFAPSGAAYDTMAGVVSQLKESGAELLIVSDREELLRQATTPFPIPTVPELLTPAVGIVAAQLFAAYLARSKGRDPDRPRGLKKVTHTL
jgi:glucosamine--fructose-6-phosphate aminotransferase (isomerizing)